MKKMKKLTSLLLVLVMSLALAVPCFAAEPAAADDGNTIYLEMGDTYTDPESGMTFSLSPLDDSDIAEMNAAKSGIALAGWVGNKYYYERGTEISSGSYNHTYTTDESFGNIFEVRIQPYASGTTVRGQLFCFYNGTKDITVSFEGVGEGRLTVTTGSSRIGIQGDIGLLLTGTPQLRTWFDVYQYWG